MPKLPRAVFAVAFAIAACRASAADAPESKPRSADAIVKEFHAVEVPSFNTANTQDRQYIQKYLEQRKKAEEQRRALATELYHGHPDHPEVPALLLDVWKDMSARSGGDVVKETDEYLKAHPDSPRKADILFTRAAATYYSTRDAEKTLAAAEAFIAAAPKDDRGAQLLSVAANLSKDPQTKAGLQRRIAEQFPNSSSAKWAKGQTRQAGAVGKPFDLTFTDAISGRQVSMDKLRGNVVVIDFWATWCGPCVAEMPKMKQLYAEFKPKGVEFVGVSLDQPEAQDGLKRLKEFVAKNEITWPQYYQGNGWESEFSSSWGINAIPRVFIVDADGNLSTTEARGRLEKLLPELLAKRGAKQTKAD